MDINSLMRNAKKMQERMLKLNEELAQEICEAGAGGGMVTVAVNGAQEVVGIKIEAEIVKPDEVGMLEDLIQAAVNEALRKSRELVKEKMSALTGGIPIPGLF